jgi:hypothetical protein
MVFANFNQVWTHDRHCTVSSNKGNVKKKLRPHFQIQCLYVGCLLYFSRMADLSLKSCSHFQQMNSFADNTNSDNPCE